jgi:hypothetical protein
LIRHQGERCERNFNLATHLATHLPIHLKYLKMKGTF